MLTDDTKEKVVAKGFIIVRPHWSEADAKGTITITGAVINQETTFLDKDRMWKRVELYLKSEWFLLDY